MSQGSTVTPLCSQVSPLECLLCLQLPETAHEGGQESHSQALQQNPNHHSLTMPFVLRRQDFHC